MQDQDMDDNFLLTFLSDTGEEKRKFTRTAAIQLHQDLGELLEGTSTVSIEDCVDNVVLRSQVEFLSKKLKKAELVLKTTKTRKHPPQIWKTRKGA